MKMFDDSIPIFVQVREEIENFIISGSLSEGESIPSIRTIARDYKLNPQTVSRALSELVNEGYLYKKRGIGLFVSENSQERLKKLKSENFCKNDLIEIVKKAKKLGLSKIEILKIIEDNYDKIA